MRSEFRVLSWAMRVIVQRRLGKDGELLEFSVRLARDVDKGGYFGWVSRRRP